MKKTMTIIMILICTILTVSACTPTEKYDLSGRTYYNTVDDYGNIEHSKVWFGKDGTFVMTDNFHDGYYQISGTWSIKENVCTMDVSNTGVGNFTKILFEINDDDTIVLKTALAGSKSDDVFTTTKPETDPNSGNNGNTAKEYRTFYNVNNKQSYLELNDDGSFALIDSNGKNTIEVNGLYGSEGDVYMFSNFDAFKNFSNGDVYNFEFRKYDEDTLILMRDLYGSKENDVFTISGKLPEGYDKDNDPATVVARFVHEPSDMTSEQYLPYIEFDSKGRFVFTENLFSGMGEISGTYELTSTGYVCKVEQSYSGWKGDDVKVIELEFKDMDTLELKTDLCMSLAGDRFSRSY